MEIIVYWVSMPLSLFFVLRNFYSSDFWGKHIRVIDVILGLGISVCPILNTIFVIFFLADLCADGIEMFFNWIMDIRNSRITKFITRVISSTSKALNYVIVENKK
jgi:hypothetical protein